MTTRHYLCIMRSPPAACDEPPAPPDAAQMAEVLARFTAWKETYASQIVDPGGRLTGGRVVTTDGITDGPYVESTDVAGGYMIVAAMSLDEATRIAQASPGVFPGSSVEVREIDAS